MKQNDRRIFVDTTPDEATATYSRVGVGFDTATKSSNTTIQTNQWISEDKGTTEITGKNIQKAISGKRVIGDDFNDFFCGLFEKIGEDCETTLVAVDMWNTPTGTVYPAKLYNVVIDCANDGSGGATDGLPISGTIYFNGEPTDGSFDTSDNTFTPNP